MSYVNAVFAWGQAPWDEQPFFDPTSVTIDAAGEKLGLLWQAPKVGNLSIARWMTNVVTVAQDIKVSLQSVDLATGLPDGVVDQFRVVPAASLISVTEVVTGILSADGTDGGTKRAVARGDLLWVVFEFAGTIGNVGIRDNYNSLRSCSPGMVAFYDGASWNRGSYESHWPLIAIQYDDGTYGYTPTAYPFTVNNNGLHSFHSGSNPDEIGNRLILPFDAKLAGVRLASQQFSSAAVDCEYVVYNVSTGAIVASFVREGAISPSVGNRYPQAWFFPTEVALSKDIAYRIVVKPTSTNAVSLQYRIVGSTSVMASLPGGADMHQTERTDGGAWTDRPTYRAGIWPLLSQIDIVAGAPAAVASTPIVSADGTVLTLVRGDDYKNADGRAPVWSGAAWPDLTGATAIKLTLANDSGTPIVGPITGTVVGAGGAGTTQVVRFDLAAADTLKLNARAVGQQFDVEAALASGSKTTLARGIVRALEQFTV